MGPIASLVFAALTLTAASAGPAGPSASPGELAQASPEIDFQGAVPLAFDVGSVRYLHLDPRVIAITRHDELELVPVGFEASALAPLEVIVTGVRTDLGPLELARHRFVDSRGPARGLAVRLPRAGLATFDQWVVSWRRARPDGTSEAGLLARVAVASEPGLAGGEEPFGGQKTQATGEPKPQGSFLTFTCPEAGGKATAGKGCTVTYAYINPANGKPHEEEKELKPGESVSFSAFLVLYASCSGC